MTIWLCSPELTYTCMFLKISYGINRFCYSIKSTKLIQNGNNPTPHWVFWYGQYMGDRIQTPRNYLRLYLTNICHIYPKSHGHNPISCLVCRTIYISNFVKPLDDHVWLSVIVCNISPIYATISIESSLEIYHQST